MPARLSYLDNLKIVLIATIIAIHGVLGYTDTGWWSYGDAREVTLGPVSSVLLMIVVGPFGLLVIPLLFLVSGLLTPSSVQRKGPARFARDRILRLGVPFVIYVLVIQAPVVYAVDHRWGNASGSYWQEFLGADGQPDTGPLWFVGVLLLYSLAYAGWVAARPARPRPMRRSSISAGDLGLAAAAITVLTFLIRLSWPLGSESPGDLNLWEWPACSALFGLGIVAAGHQWVSAVPPDLRRHSRTGTLAGAVGLLLLAGVALGLLGIDDAQLFGGWHWPALAFAACESVVTVYGAVWILGLTQRFDRPYRFTTPLARTSYTAFIVQTPVLLAAAAALRALDAPAEIKGLMVAAVGVIVAFSLAGLLLRAVPPLARIL